jgi:hypothetical protein
VRLQRSKGALAAQIEWVAKISKGLKNDSERSDRGGGEVRQGTGPCWACCEEPQAFELMQGGAHHTHLAGLEARPRATAMGNTVSVVTRDEGKETIRRRGSCKGRVAT